MKVRQNDAGRVQNDSASATFGRLLEERALIGRNGRDVDDAFVIFGVDFNLRALLRRKFAQTRFEIVRRTDGGTKNVRRSGTVVEGRNLRR